MNEKYLSKKTTFFVKKAQDMLPSQNLNEMEYQKWKLWLPGACTKPKCKIKKVIP